MTRSRREQNRTEQRERIRDAARLLFGAQGFDEVTMSAIAAKAGVARATVFNYFPSKLAIVESITEDVFAYFRAMLDAALADQVTPTPSLVRAFFAHMGSGIESTQRFYTGIFREVVKIQVGLGEGTGAQQVRAAALERLEQLMARGQARGELRSEETPRDLAQAFDSLSNGTIIHWLYDDASGSLADRMARAAEIFLGPVASPDYVARGSEVPELAPLPFDPAGTTDRRE